ncbi:hypothetical protein Cgig2_008671 [Carnegiea gigantea]|uniref:Senescence regulator n=1 Tax=Carnegiea gigantea TaxID=171969 RepID=A0A9Q1Q8Y5_9CARY|nr:hypothetical protein Cgig2_008671 [Carnegiea gigantea]
MAGRFGSNKYRKDEDFEEGDVWGVMEERQSCKKQFSAPLDIPDWSKIYGKSSKKKGMNVVTPSSSSSTTSWVHGLSRHHGHGDGYDDGNDDDDGHVEKDDDDDDGMVPPHEYIARKLARSQISSFSVCEGMGRTLKGRDLRKVRNAILTRTGFLE